MCLLAFRDNYKHRRRRRHFDHSGTADAGTLAWKLVTISMPAKSDCDVNRCTHSTYCSSSFIKFLSLNIANICQNWAGPRASWLERSSRRQLGMKCIRRTRDLTKWLTAWMVTMYLIFFCVRSGLLYSHWQCRSKNVANFQDHVNISCLRMKGPWRTTDLHLA